MPATTPSRALAIDLIIPTLGNGGAQRMVSRVASHLAVKGHRVRVITFTGSDHRVVHRPDDAVEIVPIGTHSGTRFSMKALVPVLRRLAPTIDEGGTEVVLAFQDIAGIPALLTLSGSVPVAVAERHDPATYSRPRLRAALRQAIYPRAGALVVQTRMLAARYAPALQPLIRIIPNPCPDVSRTARPGKASIASDGTRSPRRMVTVGRLERTKELGLLVDAAALAFAGRDDWQLDIHGVGPLESTLRAHITERGVEGRVRLCGHCEDVLDALADAHLFVFPSSTEGFPNALAEAVACGLPCIAFRGVSGVAELVHDGENGELLDEGARDPDNLARALSRAMDDDAGRARAGARSLEIARTFESERLLDDWERLLVALVANDPRAGQARGR